MEWPTCVIINEMAMVDAGITYIRGQLEMGNGDYNGYLHWQVFVHFKNPKRLGGVKKAFDRDDAHCEPAASEEKSLEYVWKDDTSVGSHTRFEWGNSASVGQGKNPVKELIAKKVNDCIAEGKNAFACQQILSKEFDAEFVFNGEKIDKYVQRKYREHYLTSDDPQVRESPTIVWFWGDTGSGKTYNALEFIKKRFKGNFHIKTPDVDKWWDGYCGQPCVLFDDFTDQLEPVDFYLRLLDVNVFPLQVKGSTVNINASTFVFTAKYAPNTFFRNAAKYKDWCRRFQTAHSKNRLHIQHVLPKPELMAFDDSFDYENKSSMAI